MGRFVEFIHEGVATLMPTTFAQVRSSTWVVSVLVLTLAFGWASRELAHARDRAPTLRSQTIGVDEVKMSVYKDQGNPVGRIGLYLQGETPGCSSLVSGRFVIDPGKSPHAPHVHADEEVLIVESGHGEIICDGKTTRVGPGSVMYSTLNIAHGINNTGSEPLTFYFVKWVPKAEIEAR
jgi:mannose-6-phosphate isomerase-like protein (cupin superfamily)